MRSGVVPMAGRRRRSIEEYMHRFGFLPMLRKRAYKNGGAEDENN